jgi:N-methylhydantoinase B
MRSGDAVLDVIEVEVVRNALAAAAAEMDVTIWRTSRSTVVRELLDYSTAVFDADGYNVAQSARIPQQVAQHGERVACEVRWQTLLRSD